MGQTIYPTSEEIARAAAAIRAGQLVAFPTETVYGLGANALDAEAVARIFTAKGRPATSPLIVHVDSVAMACEVVVSDWPDSASKLAERFWPGPLTLVLRKRPTIPDRVTAGLSTVGVRVPAHPVALDLIRAAGLPVAAPSANRFTGVSPTTAQHVRDGLGSAVEVILDAGPAQVGIESTVVSLTDRAPQLLRPGMISLDQLQSVVGEIAEASGLKEGAHASPGLHEKHYSPTTPLIVGTDVPSARCAYLWWKQERASARKYQMPADPAGYARELYRALHTLDREHWECIVVEPVPAGSEWLGIRDRLARAASKG